MWLCMCTDQQRLRSGIQLGPVLLVNLVNSRLEATGMFLHFTACLGPMYQSIVLQTLSPASLWPIPSFCWTLKHVHNTVIRCIIQMPHVHQTTNSLNHLIQTVSKVLVVIPTT